MAKLPSANTTSCEHYLVPTLHRANTASDLELGAAGAADKGADGGTDGGMEWRRMLLVIRFVEIEERGRRRDEWGHLLQTIIILSCTSTCSFVSVIEEDEE